MLNTIPRFPWAQLPGLMPINKRYFFFNLPFVDFAVQEDICIFVSVNKDLLLKAFRYMCNAKHISEITGIPAKAEPRLTEQNFGKYEGTPRDGEEFRIAKRDFVSRYDGGESMLHLAQRIYNLLDDVKASGKVCVLVAHNGIARVVNSYFNDMTNEEYADFGVKNCEILRYDF